MKLNQVFRLLEREAPRQFAQGDARAALAARGHAGRGGSAWWRKGAPADFEDTQPSVRDSGHEEPNDLAH